MALLRSYSQAVLRKSGEEGAGDNGLAACWEGDLRSLPWSCFCPRSSAEPFQSHLPLGFPAAAFCSTNQEPKPLLAGQGKNITQALLCFPYSNLE